jgi:hypothetical protein
VEAPAIDSAVTSGGVEYAENVFASQDKWGTPDFVDGTMNAGSHFSSDMTGSPLTAPMVAASQ